jgi:hypothetical protein
MRWRTRSPGRMPSRRNPPATKTSRILRGAAFLFLGIDEKRERKCAITGHSTEALALGMEGA